MPVLKKLKVLGLGCGYGWHCKYANDHEVKETLGIDASQRMIQEAITRNSGNNITYQVQDIETFKYPNNYYNFVLSNIALHYIEDLDSILKKFILHLYPVALFFSILNIQHLQLESTKIGYRMKMVKSNIRSLITMIILVKE